MPVALGAMSHSVASSSWSGSAWAPETLQTQEWRPESTEWDNMMARKKWARDSVLQGFNGWNKKHVLHCPTAPWATGRFTMVWFTTSMTCTCSVSPPTSSHDHSLGQRPASKIAHQGQCRGDTGKRFHALGPWTCLEREASQTTFEGDQVRLSSGDSNAKGCD